MVDFGIALVVSADVRMTMPGIVLGSPAYMAPEQLTGHPVDARADLYALGVLMFEMLSGEVPLLGSSAGELLKAKLGPAPSVRAQRPGVSGDDGTAGTERERKQESQ